MAHHERREGGKLKRYLPTAVAVTSVGGLLTGVVFGATALEHSQNASDAANHRTDAQLAVDARAVGFLGITTNDIEVTDSHLAYANLPVSPNCSIGEVQIFFTGSHETAKITGFDIPALLNPDIKLAVPHSREVIEGVPVDFKFVSRDDFITNILGGQSCQTFAQDLAIQHDYPQG